MTTLQTAQTTQSAVGTIDQFEKIYKDARGDVNRVPWSDGRAHPALVNWLNAVAPSLVRCGARVAVVGCGLGEDARELIRRGYDVTAFDCSQTAVNWVKNLDPVNERCYVVADLFNPPARWKRRFDLIVEVNTIQSLHPERRNESVAAMSELLSPHGYLLVICRGAEDSVVDSDGPPWAMTHLELEEAAALAGLVPHAPISIFHDDEKPTVCRMRAVFTRA